MRQVFVWAFVGLVCSSLVACEAEPGERGQDGAVGANGKNGANGKDGEPGPAGEKGTKGEQGDPGAKGDPGATGATGDQGSPGVKGDQGDTGATGATGADGSPGLSSLIRTGYELAGAACAFGGTRIETGLDVDRDGVLDEDEIDASATQYLCKDALPWTELVPLPVVTTVHGFALTASADDGSAHLGFMFTDAAYQQALLDDEEIWNGGGVYSGPNTYVTYEFDAGGAAWDPYEGRMTPQTYSFSELVVADGSSYYTTLYPAFGGLISMIRNGGTGTFALTPAFTTRKAHSIAVLPGGSEVWALIAQNNGVRLSRFPISQFGNLSNVWVSQVLLHATASSLATPNLLVAGTRLVGAYVLGDTAFIRVTSDPFSIAEAADFLEIGTCEDAVVVDIAWDGTYLYAACLDSEDVLLLRRTSLSDLENISWETVPTHVAGAIDRIDLEASSTGVSLALRQGTAIRVYESASDARPEFDAVLPGSFDMARTSDGVVLAVCDAQGDKTLRTFVH